MSTFLDAARIAANRNWIERVNLMALDAAVDILAEDPAAADHEVRVKLAYGLIQGRQDLSAVFPKLVLTNETIRASAVADIANFGATVPDGDLQFTIASTFTAVAKSYFS
jgi:hypothetical protein